MSTVVAATALPRIRWCTGLSTFARPGLRHELPLRALRKFSRPDVAERPVDSGRVVVLEIHELRQRYACRGRLWNPPATSGVYAEVMGAHSRRWILLAVLAGMLAACAASAPRPTGDAPFAPSATPKVFPAGSTSGSNAPGGSGPLATCGGRTFPASGLAAPTGAETAAGPEYDALRATITKFAPEFPGAGSWLWQLAGRDDAGAIFLAKTDALGAPGWVYIEVDNGPSGWQPGSIGQCEPHTVLSADFGPATWALDPAFAAPGPTTTELHVLVWELACSSGTPTTGRMSDPVIDYGSSTVTITIGVRPLSGVQTCPGIPGTPDLVRLTEPLGTRALLDGGHVPPAPPSPMF